jgi:hypothetical protein
MFRDELASEVTEKLNLHSRTIMAIIRFYQSIS